MNGDVRLRVEGLMLEKLVERALMDGARFRSIRRDGPRTMIFETDPAGAEVLGGLCERFSIACTVIRRKGRDAMLRKLKQRATLMAGIVVCLAAMAMFLSRIWLIDIELTGGRNADVRPLKAALNELGVKPGMTKAGLDTGFLEDALAASSPDFSFVGVQLQGVRLLVEAAPAVSAPEVYNLEGGRDLVARCDGVVAAVNVQSGLACVKPGDTVVRGQVLIRGDERVTKEESRSIAALGSVVARTWHVGMASAPAVREECMRTGRSSVSSELRLLGFAWPLVHGESYPQQETETEILPIGGLFLPLGIVRTTAWETVSRSMEVDENALRSALAALACADAGAKLCQSHPDGAEIADRWIEYTYDAGIYYTRAVYETHTDIAVTRDALYQQGG